MSELSWRTRVRSVAPVPDPPAALRRGGDAGVGAATVAARLRATPFGEGGSAGPAAERKAQLVVDLELWAARVEGCCAAFEAARFCEHSLLTAWLAEALGRELVEWLDSAPGALFEAGLLHDAGRLVLAERRPEEYAAILAAASPEAPLHALEVAAFGCTHAQVSALAAEEWGLGREVSAALGSHHGPRRELEATPLASAVAFADRVAKRVQEGLSADPLELETEPVATFWGVGSGAVDEIEARAIGGLERLRAARRRPGS